MDTQNNQLHFRVSSGLKRVLGRELITNNEVAIFELVKNSFDAGAKNVYIQFDVDAIVVADDGAGMSYEDIRNKWLFVAYSSKRNTIRENPSEDYRNQVAGHRQYAGSKGVGRFSSDRLGQSLTLQTRTANDDNQVVNCLDINWADFEEDDTDQFSQINVIHRVENQFLLPDGIPDRRHGTVIRMGNLLMQWSREDLLKLKAGLSKLINPFGMGADNFVITIIAKHEEENDNFELVDNENKSVEKKVEHPPIVNGLVGNFIFSTLQQKTTFIDVSIDPVTKTIQTVLTDRGEAIYKVREPNPYHLLQDAEFKCQLYFLNRAAKATFARRMGLPSVRFGSVFVFRNGFRVFPIGEEGDDYFRIDRRKQQGFRRFLGTRDVIGRIDVSGTEDLFQEASSRNQGLIETPAVDELKRCFFDHCLKRLERYVVPVSWGTKDVETDTLAFLESDSGRARVSAAFANLIGNEDVEVLEYSKRIIDTLSEQSEQFESSLTNLRIIATSTGDQELATRIKEAELRFTELKQSEAEARRIADEERRAKQEAEARAQAALAEAESAKEELGEERKRNLFLMSVTSLDAETILDMHHLITIYGADLQQQIENFMRRISKQSEVSREAVVNSLEPIALLNRKVLAVARFATKANFRLDSERIEEDLSDYIASYIEGIARSFAVGRMTFNVTTDNKKFKRQFKPIDVSIVIDNMLSNARKARATQVNFDLKQVRKDLLEIRVSDDGKGIDPQLVVEGRLFAKGVTTTNGSGLGLYHVRQVISEMGGSVEVSENDGRGAEFLVRIPLCD